MTEPVLIDLQPGLVDLIGRAHKRYLDCSKLTLPEAQQLGDLLIILQRGIQFWVGDLARYCNHRWPENGDQAWPVDASLGLIQRTAGVCAAYPTEAERAHDCSYSQYMQFAGKADRQGLLAEVVANGLTTDESRKGPKAIVNGVPEGPQNPGDYQPRWLLAVDCNYFLHRFWHSGAGVEAATGVASWIKRTVERLREKGLTDVACCFDSHINHRKELTKDWEDKYKDRPMKEPELAQQLNLVRELIEREGFAAISVEGMEADDVMASYAKQFQGKGKVTLLTQDKDQRQCLSSSCNILLDVEWKLDEHSGDHLPEYKWLSAKQHTEATTLTPAQWIDYQCIAGDNVDGIRGIEGIGVKGACDLLQEFGTLEAVLAAAKALHPSIKEKKRLAIIAFESKLEVTRTLVTLRDDLKVPNSTRLT
jgi:5'-3' exonuclease